MIVERDREKLLNALIYFSENVLYPGKTKLYKLLNYLDFLHFEKTGRAVTGLTYYAWKMGPVPKALHEEIDRPSKDFIEHLSKKSTQLGGGKKMQSFFPRKKFDSSLFSPFELDLLERLAKRHFKDTASEISEKTHFETGPWHEVWEVNNNKYAEIPYDLVLLRRGNADDMVILEKASEYKELKRNYS